VARDATARLYDVDDHATVLDKRAGTVTFRAREGRFVDLDKLHESLWATRLGDRTGMVLHRMDVTAEGEAVVEDGNVVLKASDGGGDFVLAGETGDDEEKSPLDQLREAVRNGEKVVKVTGRLDGWNGNFTQFLRELPEGPRRILVKSFETAE
jgi:hypothetical protein